MTKQDRKAAIRAFTAALIEHDTAIRLKDLEARVREVEDIPARFAQALRNALRDEIAASRH